MRFEVTLRSKELEKLESIPRTPDEARVVWQTYYDKVTWNRNARMVEADMLEVELPRYLQGTLAMWRQGTDLRAVLSKTSFYRQRRELLAQIGVDIAAAPPPKTAARADAPAPTLDPKGWDPEPLEGYVWNRNPRLLP